MLSEAIKKINDEIDKQKNNPYVSVIGQFLLQYINDNPGVADKVVNTDKTILKSLDEMKKAAEKKRFGNCAVLTDAEGFAIVLKYFDIDGTAPISAPAVKVAPTPSASSNETEKKSSIDFDIKFEDFI